MHKPLSCHRIDLSRPGTASPPVSLARSPLRARNDAVASLFSTPLCPHPYIQHSAADLSAHQAKKRHEAREDLAGSQSARNRPPSRVERSEKVTTGDDGDKASYRAMPAMTRAKTAMATTLSVPATPTASIPISRASSAPPVASRNVDTRTSRRHRHSQPFDRQHSRCNRVIHSRILVSAAFATVFPSLSPYSLIPFTTAFVTAPTRVHQHRQQQHRQYLAGTRHLDARSDSSAS